MTHHRMLDRAPSVMITSNQNELKLYQDNTVYLNDGDNFELRFFNPLQEKIGVEIVFNGIRKGDGYLVLNPGQDLTLDRFLDEQRKMLFETYTVDGNSQEAIEAIQKNGIITFNFYKQYYNNFNNANNINVNYNFPNNFPNNYTGNYPLNSVYTTSNSNSRMYSKGVQGSNGLSGLSGTLGTNTTFTSPGVPFLESDMSFCSSNTNNLFSSSVTTNSLETGRVEKGEASSQKLKNVNLQFCSSSFHSVEYKILPYSAMNKTSNEVRQYCSSCGYRLRKQTWSFCPKCGEKLD